MIKGLRFKSVSVGYNKRQPRELKVEFPGGMVFITTGLSDSNGNEVVHVSVTADGDRFAGDPKWWAHCGKPTKTGIGVRIIKGVKP